MTTLPDPDASYETVVETYDRVAALYDWLVTPLQAGTRQRALDVLAIERGDHAVAAGSGPGHGVVALAERVGPDGDVVGFDAAAIVAGRPRRRAVREGAKTHIEICLGDARSIPFRANVADVVLSRTRRNCLRTTRYRQVSGNSSASSGGTVGSVS
jgi:demethylmenaquinone methyltransferase/2-methoxy-6-polyprenyl-1,4-benzoquinol methylase